MELLTDDLRIQLDRGRTLRLSDALGATVRVTRGELWMTQEGDPRDVVLGPGDTFSIDRGGLSVLQALSAATVTLGPAASHVPARSASRSGIRMPRRWYAGASNAA
jgi:hypothetical protein